MKKGEKLARREVGAMSLIFIGAFAVIALFGVLLWLSIVSIDGAKGLYKTSPDTPESLVSLGAPRSQLDLERMFSSMKAEYSEDGVKVCEPITAEYRKSVEDRISKGERASLSVEEILYIISDSVELYDKYDSVRLILSDGTVKGEIKPIKDLSAESVPYYVASEKKTKDILSIIKYRIFALSSPDVITETDSGFVYTPEYTERAGEKSFTITDEISFNTDNGRSVRLYPTEKQIKSADSTVILESKRALGRAEREVLVASGYNADLCRNVTPEYMYGKTDIRLVAVGGRVLIVDVDSYVALDILPQDERFLSVALCDGGIYVTSSGDGSSSLWHYESKKGASLIIEIEEKYVGIYDDGDTLGLYVAEKVESKTYITVLVRSGEPIMKIEK